MNDKVEELMEGTDSQYTSLSADEADVEGLEKSFEFEDDGIDDVEMNVSAEDVEVTEEVAFTTDFSKYYVLSSTLISKEQDPSQ